MSKMFITYVTTWGTPPLTLIQDMISKSVLTKNSLVLLAFASFNFSSTDYKYKNKKYFYIKIILNK